MFRKKLWTGLGVLFAIGALYSSCSDVLSGSEQNVESVAEGSQEGKPSTKDGGPQDKRRSPEQPGQDARAQDQGGSESSVKPEPPQEQATEPLSDASAADQTEEKTVPEGGLSDTGPLTDTGPLPDTPQPPTGCGVTTFQYDTGGQSVKAVMLAGSFNGWSQTATPMKKSSSTLWKRTITLPEGTHQYKFVVDGKWTNDPKNPSTVPDGVGGKNNTITVQPCAKPALKVATHNTQGGSFAAAISFVPGKSGAGLAGSPAVTVDRKPAPAGSVVVQGNTIQLSLKGLAKGIHDVRINAKDRQGVPAPEKLLKVYVGVSKDWRDVVLYFAMIDRFLNADKSNDKPYSNTPKMLNYQGGDFKGLSQKIDSGYFDQLGVNAIWITWPIDNPNHPEPGLRFDSHWCNMNPKDKNIKWVKTNYTGFHGYWPVELDKVEEHFGTLQELQDLVDKAHKRGIRVLLDFTVNHVHSDSPLYQKNKTRGFFHTPAQICDDVGWDNAPITCWFVGYLPDINYTNRQVARIMLDHVVDWVKKTGADGLRIDALKHIHQSFIREIRKRTTAEFEDTGVDFYMVGETFTGDTGLIKKFVSKDQVHGQFDFPLNLQILKAFAKYETGLNDLDRAARGMMKSYGRDALMSTFIGNHDIARFVSMASGDIRCGAWDVISNRAQSWKNPPKVPNQKSAYDKLKIAFAYIFALPGIPLIYYGDEFGLPGAGDPDNRRMMRFGNQLNSNEKDTLLFMQTLGKARKTHEVLRRGQMGPTLWANSDILVFSRTHTSGTAIVVINRGKTRTISVAVGQLNLPNGSTLKNALGNNSVTVKNGSLAIQANGLQAAIYIK